MFAQCDQWQCSSEQEVTKESREFILTIFIKGNNFEEEVKCFSQQVKTQSRVGIIVLFLPIGQITQAEEFVPIPKILFFSKNPTKEEIFDYPMYQQKATELPHPQRTNPNFERNNDKKVQDEDININESIKRTKSSGDATSDTDDLKTESFLNDDGNREPKVKKKWIVDQF